jgi:hypothetical protein
MAKNGMPTAFDLTLHATDVDANDTLTWSILTPASHGTASVSGAGLSKDIEYTPAADYVGADSFVVQVDDGNGGTDSITVDVTVEEPSSIGLISYWNFNEGSGSTTSDVSPAGHANTGTLMNGPQWISGPFGNAVSFDPGYGQHISTLNNDDSLSIPFGGMTVSAWIKVSDVSDVKNILVKDKAATTSRGNYSLAIADGKVRFGFSQASDHVLCCSDTHLW